MEPRWIGGHERRKWVKRPIGIEVQRGILALNRLSI